MARNVRMSEIERELMLREAEELSGSFLKFVEAAWPLVEPGAAFINGMHVEAICEHLQACESRQVRKLLVNVQPRCGKSTIISVLFPAWLWTKRPEERILSASYSDKLAMRDSVASRRVVESDWYRARWPEVRMVSDQNRQSIYENTRLGRRQTTSVGGGVTGLGGSFLILDDPHNALYAESKVCRESDIEWYRNSWATRKNPNPLKPPVYIVVMQRLHEMDLSGHLLEHGGWDHLMLPTEYEDGPKKYTSIGWCDPRKQIGEVLWPAIQDTPEGRADLADLKKTLGSYGVAGQLQQRPVPKGGGIIKSEWLCFHYDEDKGIPEPISVQLADGTSWVCPQKALPKKIAFEDMVHSWDLAFKAEEDNDYVVGQVWATSPSEPANRYLLHQDRGQYDFPATKEAIRRMRRGYAAGAILVEEKANGSGILTELKNEIPGLIPVNPEGGKVARCHSVAPGFEAGNVWLPHPRQNEWVQGYVDELTMFPRGRNDDQVDATTQALRRMAESTFVEMDLAPMILGSEPNPFLC